MEANLQRRIARMLREQGDYVFNVVGNPMQQRGTADLLVCHQGLFLAIEVKDKGGKESKLQQFERHKVDAAGGIAGVAWGMDEVVALIRLAEMNRR
jgi:Holliday junction resolvase